MSSILNLLIELDSESDEEINNLIILHNGRKRVKSVRKTEFLKLRKKRGEFRLFEEFADIQFVKYFRLNRKEFEEIHELIKKDIEGLECNAQQPIETQDKLAVCLRYLATDDPVKTISHSYRMGERTVSEIITEVCKAIWRHLQPIYLLGPTAEMWENISVDFKNKYQFYNCLGGIDGYHVTVKKPPNNTGSSFFNYKQYCSIVLMVTVDANYKFTTIDVGQWEDSVTETYLAIVLYLISLHLPDL